MGVISLNNGCLVLKYADCLFVTKGGEHSDTGIWPAGEIMIRVSIVVDLTILQLLRFGLLNKDCLKLKQAYAIIYLKSGQCYLTGENYCR